ncbi:MAG TPA: dihydrolipoyl dehydrogenase [Candidatus Binatia bacterium]|nr:dihydrolipoyl dehydrogenase [Candidatus Binatia bacterium]
MEQKQHDLVVIGAGPGGYVAAIRAAQLGLNVACVEKEPDLGGTCLRIGCIPSKALLESSELFWRAKEDFADHGIRLKELQFDLPTIMRRKEKTVRVLSKGVDSLFRKNKISRYAGTGRIVEPGRVVVDNRNGAIELKSGFILIATGSKPATLPHINLDGDRVATSTEALSYKEVPGHLVVIGAGAVGLELGSVWKRFGAKVTVLELMDRILPEMDHDMARDAMKLLERQGLEFQLQSSVMKVRVEGNRCVVECEGKEATLCDRVLVAVGRLPCTDGLDLEALSIKTDKKGYITIDENYATSAAGIYAIGDVVGGPMLAHKAQEEGIACVERMVTGYGHVDYDTVPNVVYTHPEIASVGKTEEDLKRQKIDYRSGVFPFRANGRAHTLGQTEGKVKVLAEAKNDRILGVHILGARAGDLIAEAATAMAFSASSEDIARSCHAHPTLPEALREAALAAGGRALHS